MNELDIEITYDELMKCAPCYDPADRGICTTDAKMRLSDILLLDIPAGDRIWAITRFLPDKVNRKFAVWNLRRAWEVLEIPPNVSGFLDYLDNWGNGNISKIKMREYKRIHRETIRGRSERGVPYGCAKWAAYQAIYAVTYWAIYESADEAAEESAYWAQKSNRDWKESLRYLSDVLK